MTIEAVLFSGAFVLWLAALVAWRSARRLSREARAIVVAQAKRLELAEAVVFACSDDDLPPLPDSIVKCVHAWDDMMFPGERENDGQ